MAWLFETMVLAIRLQDDRATRLSISQMDETEHDVGSDEDLDVFLDKLIHDTQDRLQNGFSAGRRGIGFVA